MPSQLKAYALLGALVLALAAVVGAYLKGYHDADRAAEVATLKSKIESQARDLEIAASAATRAQIRQAEAQANELQAQADLDDYKNSLVPNNGCKLTPDNLDRLRELARGHPKGPTTDLKRGAPASSSP